MRKITQFCCQISNTHDTNDIYIYAATFDEEEGLTEEDEPTCKRFRTDAQVHSSAIQLVEYNESTSSDNSVARSPSKINVFFICNVSSRLIIYLKYQRNCHYF